MKIRLYQPNDFAPVLDIILSAFEPHHESFREILGQKLFEKVHPDWRATSKEYLTKIAVRDAERLLVAVAGEEVVGFLVYFVKSNGTTGEIGLNAVRPERQGEGIGPLLYEAAMERMKEVGVSVVELTTGADEAHARARAAYEKSGFKAMELVRYYKAI